ncbi:MAG: virulence RhuM family protein [Verrucomicrobia bacterium]|nr:virulence RhuM family protein [Verrucomicrobiota bacterium]
MSDLIPAPTPSGGEFLFYQSDDGRIRLQVRLKDESVWLSLNQMADLFQRDKSVISRHINNVFEEGELLRNRVVANYATTASDGKIYQVEFYNLDVIISVGYRVKSQRGTQFRIWATQRLREYIVKGFTMDDERLKQRGGGNYFDWLARLDDFLRLGGRDILKNAGKISHEQAVQKAELEFEKFHRTQLALPSQVEKDFDAAVKALKKLPAPGRKKKQP